MLLSFTLVFLVVGVLLVALAIPLIRRRVRPNALYGLRVDATFADEEVWYEANARSGWDLLYVGMAQIIVSVVLTMIPGIRPEVYALANAGTLLVAVVWMAVIGWRRANRLLTERRSRGASGSVELP